MSAKIISIDNTLDNLALIERYARSLSWHVESFQSLQAAESTLAQKEYDLVLLSSKMEEGNILEYVQAFRKEDAKTPIIMSIETDTKGEFLEAAVKAGVSEFLNQTLHFATFQVRLQNMLTLSQSAQGTFEKEKEALKANEQEALEVIGKCIDLKEHKAKGHTQRVAHYAQLLAKEAKLNAKVQDLAFHASQLYDIGKLAIDEKLLCKEAKLEIAEYEQVQTHARAGYDVLKYSQSPYLKAAAVISYSHHEKYDGSGYPIGLKGETIPILGRILAIVDVFDALTQDRAYAKAVSVDEACAYLVEQKGKHFDPGLVDVWMQNIEAIKEIKSRFKNEV